MSKDALPLWARADDRSSAFSVPSPDFKGANVLVTLGYSDLVLIGVIVCDAYSLMQGTKMQDSLSSRLTIEAIVRLKPRHRIQARGSFCYFGHGLYLQSFWWIDSCLRSPIS